MELKRSVAISVFFFFFFVYLFTASGRIDVTPGSMRYQVAKSLIDHGDVDITKPDGYWYVAIREGADGRYYAATGIGQSLLMVPLVFVAGYAGATVLNQILSGLVCVVIFLFCLNLGYSRRTSIFVTFLYALGTIAWPYSKTTFHHAQEILFVLLAVYLMYQSIKKSSYCWLALSSFSLGMAILTRPTPILALIPLAYLLFINRFETKKYLLLLKDSAVYFAVLAPFISFNLWYNFYRFGSIWGWISTGGEVQKTVERVGGLFSTPVFTGLYGQLLSPGKSFFLYSPIAILFFFCLKSFYRREKQMAHTFIIFIVTYLLFYSCYYDWSGDWAWGPRLIVFLTPFFIIPLGEFFEDEGLKKSRLAKSAIIFLFILGIIVQLSSVTINNMKYFLKIRPDPLITIKSEAHKYYSNPRNSPLLVQFQQLYEVVSKMKDYTFAPVPEELEKKALEDFSDKKALSEFLKADLSFNVLDFWYVYWIYFGVPKKVVAIVLAPLICLIAFSGLKLYKFSRMS